MARRRRRPDVRKKGGVKEKPLTRKHLARREREAIQLRRIRIALTLVGILVIGILGFGAYQEFAAKPNAPVAIVNGVPIRLSDYQRRVRYERWRLQLQEAELRRRQAQLDSEAKDQKLMAQYLSQQLQQVQTMMSQVPRQTVQRMIDDELVRQEATRRGITVSEEELQQNIEEQFGYYRTPPTPTPTPTAIAETLSIATPVPTPTPRPTPTPITLEQFQKAYRNYIEMVRKQTGMSETDLREVLRTELLRQKLQEALAAEVPTTAEQVHARHILVKTEDEARQVLERLNKGESFELLAKELSTDESTKDKGGDLGWFPRGQMVPAFEEAAFNAKVGEIVGPVQTSFGWHIIKVEGHEVRELEPGMLQFQRSQALDKWLAKARLGEGVKNLWRPEMVPPTEIPLGG